MGETEMTRTIEQNIVDMEIATMRMNQSRDKLCDAIMAGDASGEARLEMVHAAAIADFKDLRAERRYLDRTI
jgi:hypothetical protein